MKAAKKERRGGRLDLLDAWLREGAGLRIGRGAKQSQDRFQRLVFIVQVFFLNEMPLAVVALCMVIGQGRAAEWRTGYWEKPSLKVCPTHRSHSMAHLRPPRGP